MSFLNRVSVSLVAVAALATFSSVDRTGFFTSQAFAAEEEEERKYADVKTKQRQAVGKKCAKLLEPIQALFGGETEPTDAQLNKAGRDLKAKLGKGCDSSYEKSQVWNMVGFVEYSLERYGAAVDAYLKMIKEPDVDERQKVSTRYTVAQLYMVQENYAEAAKQLEQWMKEATIVSAQGKVLLAQAYYQVGRKNDALRMVNGVIADAEAKGELPKEGWWGLQRVLYYEKEDYQRVTNILKKLVTHYPKVSYWRQLGGMFSQLEQEMNQLVAYDVVYLQKGLSKERQRLTLAYLYLGAGVPYKAAVIIDDGMREGIIEETGKNLEVLGSAWQQAQHFGKAAQVLERAAKTSGKGTIYARLANVYLDQDKNEQAVRAAKNAIRKGGLKRPSATYLTLGSAQINLHCYSDARKAFKEAAKEKRSAKTANQWIAFADHEGTRRGKLIKSGAKISGCKKV